jgi:hypothetical protein
MRSDWASLSQSDRAHFLVLRVLLADRLTSVEAINWALATKQSDRLKRIAMLDLVDGPEGRKLVDPWRSAWRTIEEVWDSQSTSRFDDIRPYDLGERAKAGDRSGSLIAATVEHVAPRIEVSPVSRWPRRLYKAPKNPRNVNQLLTARLGSAKAVDPRVLTLDQIDDVAFLVALTNGLEGALNRGLDTARRFGWNGEIQKYRLGDLYRVYFVAEADRKPDEHEPDEFHEGIAPCVKLLHFVVSRLARLKAPEAQEIVRRWAVAPTAIHLRLWSALARDPGMANRDVVGQKLVEIDDDKFWGAYDYPEVAELRARRFGDLTTETQRAVTKRLCKTPPRRQFPRDAKPDRVASARRYWAVRELRRIELAGGTLDAAAEAWLSAQLPDFLDLVAMTRIDEGFPGTHEATYVTPKPDIRFDSLSGNERLLALESALREPRRGWDDDVSSRASDWMRTSGNSAKLIADLEAAPDAGGSYSKIWEQFGWSHSPAGDSRPAEEQLTEVNRVLKLLIALPTGTLSAAIEALSAWLSSWRQLCAKSPHCLDAWLRLWPIAVEATNAAQPPDEPIDLNLVARSSDPEDEPKDFDTLNTPAGRLTDVLLTVCPSANGKENPFLKNYIARTMRDSAIAQGGRSGLVVRHRLTEHLAYFLRADPSWTEQHLIKPLLDDSPDAVILWRAVARRTLFVDVLRIIGSAVLIRASDLRLGRDTRRMLVFSLVVECLHALLGGREPAVPFAGVQQMLRALDDELRANAAGAVQQFVREMAAGGRFAAPDLFAQAAAPFLRDVWPQERSLTTPGVSKALADLPATARAAFVPAVDAIERFLVPFEAWSMLDYGLYGDEDHEPKLSLIDTPPKASALLRLLDATVGSGETAVIPNDLATALARIEKISPPLAHQPSFRRLATAARR